MHGIHSFLINTGIHYLTSNLFTFPNAFVYDEAMHL